MAYQDTVAAPGRTIKSLPRVRAIAPRDLIDVLARGWEDFRAIPSHAVFLSLLYPIAGVVIGGWAFRYDLVPLLYPLITGFALLGPVAAIGIYALSRRREQGLDTTWNHAFDLLSAESFWGIVALGLALLVIFAVWIWVAQAIYVANFGYAPPTSFGDFVQQVLTTPGGHRVIIVGNLVGLLFAIVAFSLSVVSFPLLIDRNIGAIGAAVVSVKAVLRNPLTMALWGLIVASVLFVASLPVLIGLAVAIPVLGHATWHLYRKIVVPELPPREPALNEPRGRRYAADFPAVLFPVYDEERQQ
jgi:uncharacterized membrane protein